MKQLGEITNDILLGLEARMRAQRGRHAWDDAVRPTPNTTYRSCRKCGLMKITRHEPDNVPRHWTEWERDGAKVTTAGTPVCDDGIAAPAHRDEDAA